MKRTSLQKDTLREIKKTFGRFISIVLLIAIAVLAFTGLQIIGFDMKKTAGEFMDDTKMLDVAITSTFGLDEVEQEVINQLENTSYVDYAYFHDGMIEKEQIVMRAHSLTNNIKRYEIKEGRLPEKNNEIAIDYQVLANKYNIGDTLTLLNGDGEKETEFLKESTFTVVGFVQSPDYLIDDARGNSMLGNGVVSAFSVLQKDVFNYDVYTTALLKFKGTDAYPFYSDEYEQLVQDEAKVVQTAFDGIGDVRVKVIKKSANQEIMDGEKKVLDGKQKILDAANEIQQAEAELADGEAKYEQAVVEFAKKILESEGEVAASESLLATSKAELEKAQKEIDSTREQLDAAKMQLDSANKQLTEVETQLAQDKATLQSSIAEVESGMLDATNTLATLEAQRASLQSLLDDFDIQIPTLEIAITNLEAEIADLEQQGQPIPPEKIAELSDLKNQKQTAITERDAAQIALAEVNSTILQLETTISGLETTLVDLKKKETILLAGEKELIAQREVLDGKIAEVTSGYAQLTAGQKKIDENTLLYEDGVSKLAAGKKELEQGRIDGEIALEKASKELYAGKFQLIDAKNIFEKESKKAEKELKKAKKDLVKAKKDLDALSKPLYMIDELPAMQSYAMIGDSTEGLDVLSYVFPTFVYFVAMLVCLTTMSRMVDEQRIQIGTLKSLGYSNRLIRRKYLVYGFAASVIGVIIGTILGHFVLPLAVFKAYQPMMSFRQFGLNFSLTNTLISFAISIVCTVAVAYYTCNQLLKENTAQLLRGKAPTGGSRIFLERLTFIWKRMSFTYKVTARNLFRYKQRMLMTIIGVAGSTALIMFGIGLHNSISNLNTLQFGELSSYDVLSIYDDDSQDAESYKELLKTEPKVEVATSLLYETYTTRSRELSPQEVSVIVPDELSSFEQLLTVRNRKSGEKIDLFDDTIIVSEKLLSMLGKKVGDEIELKNNENVSTHLVISGVAEEYSQHKLYMNKTTYEKNFAQDYQKNAYLIQLKDGEDSSKFAEKIQKNGAVSFIFETKESEKQINQTLNSLIAVFFIIIFLACLLATVVLYNLTNINIAERERELSTIKVLGFYDKEVTMYIYRETFILTFIGAIVGFIPGKLLHLYICYNLAPVGIMFPLQIMPINYMLTIGFIMLVSFIVMKVMHKKMRNIDMVEALKSVE